MDEDDDAPTLSAETFAALQEFYEEQERRQDILAKLEANNQLKENILFEEDWQLSQFWYDETTVQSLVKAIDKQVRDGGRVALISCPTLFVPLKRHIGDRATVSLLEYDRRFEVHAPDFIWYDYNSPEKLPPELVNACDVVVADPPFLSEECLEKVSRTVRLVGARGGRVVLCSGAAVQGAAERLLALRRCRFRPRHRNNLGNEFASYANFDLDAALA